MPVRRSTGVYDVRAVFRVPLAFVYRWCTDYSSMDPQLEKDRYARRVLSQTPRRVVYEDLYDTPHGWVWSRETVTLRPPDRWRAETIGSHSLWRTDYTLRDLGDGRTELRLRGRRRPTPLGAKNTPPTDLEAGIRRTWRNFRTALEQDYRNQLGRSRHRKR